jgi:NAD(P)-dependent dehydrogenase (short-subunit alcohol dehydrogenase family)
MGALDGRVVIITGAGRGIGREHALLFASEGAHVVVNDLGGATDGSGADKGPAQEVVEEIEAAGGVAVANTDSVTSWDGAEQMVRTAVDTFGELHALVNNAGILRDRLSFNMTEDEWDAVVDVHMKGHFCTTRAAAAYWREQQKAGKELKAAIVNTSSGAGLIGNPGQLNYAAAKAGIAAMTIVEALELGRYGVRANCMLVAYLATADCPFNGGVFHVVGNEVGLFQGWTLLDRVTGDGRWSVDGLAKEAPRLLDGRPPLASQGTSLAELFALGG